MLRREFACDEQCRRLDCFRVCARIGRRSVFDLSEQRVCIVPHLLLDVFREVRPTAWSADSVGGRCKTFVDLSTPDAFDGLGPKWTKREGWGSGCLWRLKAGIEHAAWL